MDVILHVGAHRTATSSFQAHLAHNRPGMADRGTVYWGPRITRGGLFAGIIGGVDAILPWQVRRATGRVGLRLQGVVASGASRLIVSDENMMGSMRGTLDEGMLYPDAGPRVAAHAAAFAPHRLRIALGVRDYAQWWSSALAFRAIRGGPVPSHAFRRQVVGQSRRWRHVIEDVARAVPSAQITVYTFEAMALDPSALLRGISGIETPPAMGEARNRRPRPEAVRKVFEDCCVPTPDLVGPLGDFMPFTPDEYQALCAQYDEDRAWLAAGADGLANYLDGSDNTIPRAQGRGSDHGGDPRRLA